MSSSVHSSRRMAASLRPCRHTLFQRSEAPLSIVIVGCDARHREASTAQLRALAGTKSPMASRLSHLRLWQSPIPNRRAIHIERHVAQLGARAHWAALAAEGWIRRGLSNVDAFICSASLVSRRPSEQTSSLLMPSERRAKRTRCSSRVFRRRTAMPCSSSNRVEHASRRLTRTLIYR